MKKRSGFFKFFIIEKSAVQMRIPTAFIASIGGSLPETVFLRDGYNNIWLVKVAKLEGNWYFQDGWAEFVKDNMVNSCDFLVFDYFDRDLFHFKILGPNGVETKGITRASVPIAGEEAAQQSQEMETEEGYIVKIRREEAAYDEQEVEEEEKHDDEITEDADYLPSNHQASHEHRGTRKYDNNGSCDENPIVYASKYTGADIFRDGLAPLPKNPYFVIKAKRRRINDLFIPLPLIKDHKIELPVPEMVLVDPSGREFRAKYKKWKDGRILYCGGWRALCHMNLLSVGDSCICEFMQRKGRPLYLRVSFVRANRN